MVVWIIVDRSDAEWKYFVCEDDLPSACYRGMDTGENIPHVCYSISD